VTIRVPAGRKVARKDPVVTSAPNTVTPLWHGFMFDFLEHTEPITSHNRDFSSLLINRNHTATTADQQHTANPPTEPQPSKPARRSLRLAPKPSDQGQDSTANKRKRDDREFNEEVELPQPNDEEVEL
jgi:hypothetical protein